MTADSFDDGYQDGLGDQVNDAHAALDEQYAAGVHAAWREDQVAGNGLDQ